MKIGRSKRISIALLLVWSLVMLTTMTFAQEEQKTLNIIVNGENLSFDGPTIIEEGRTLVPLRAIFESLEAEVEWDSIGRKITARKGEIIIVLYVGNKVAGVNGESITLDVPPKIVDGRTFVPVRFISESLGADVDWDGINRIVKISTEKSDTGMIRPGLNLTENKLAIIPEWVETGLNLSIIDKRYDSAKIYMDALSVQKGVNISEIKPPEIYDIVSFKPDQNIIWSTGCDYSPYVTFQGNQSNAGGCAGRSLVHIMNILTEREHMYTPDVSFWYLHGRQEELADGGPLDTQYVLESNGICPEASAHSNYDKAVKKTNADGSIYYDYSEMPKSNSWTNYLASYYRMKESDKFEPTIENIKYALRNYGPLLAGGDLFIIQGEKPEQGHAVTIVGYNDLTRTVKCLNSWSDIWGPTEDGYFTVSYDDLAENFSSIRFYLSLPVERAGTDQAYSARIHIDTGYYSRIKLKVTIGIDGRSPFTVWDTPNENVFIDYSKTLKLDVPLPFYAIDFWPPEKGTHWYVEVTNTSTWDIAELKEITLAKLIKDSSGEYTIETFKSPEAGTIMQPGETRKFYIPKKDTIMTMPIDQITKPIISPFR